MAGILMAMLAYQALTRDLDDRVRIEYSTFRRHLKDGKVARITVTGEEITGELSVAATREVGDESVEYTHFLTYLPPFGDDELLGLLERHGTTMQVEPDTGVRLHEVFIAALPWILMIGIAIMIMRRMQAQGQSMFSIGKTRVRLFDASKSTVRFDDVAGAHGAKSELQEMVGFLDDPQRFQRVGARTPKGILLVGAPGTGKTLLARAVAGEAGVPFLSITGSDFMEMFVGVGASRVRDTFREAKKRAPSIIFIDELDSIGRRRGAGLGGGHDEREQTLNQLLSELDGFEPSENVLVMAATNRPDTLDPALLRPGRFDRRITVDLPTQADRVAILQIHVRNRPLDDDVNLEEVARGMPGATGADLENIVNEAAMEAARRQAEKICAADIERARDKVLLGMKRETMVLSEQECQLIAYHEAGHAVTAAVLEYADPLYKVSIVPRAESMGVTQQVPERDMYVRPRQYLDDRLAVIMSGRAAEELVLQIVSTGAENDFREATQIARKMVLDWGMGQKLGPMTRSGGRDEVFLGGELAQRREFSEATAREVDEEVRDILTGAQHRALETLKAHRPALERLAASLREQEELSGEMVLQIIQESADAVPEQTVEGIPGDTRPSSGPA